MIATYQCNTCCKAKTKELMRTITHHIDGHTCYCKACYKTDTAYWRVKKKQKVKQ